MTVAFAAVLAALGLVGAFGPGLLVLGGSPPGASASRRASPRVPRSARFDDLRITAAGAWLAMLAR